MNAQSDEENFINDNTSNPLIISEDSENILEHALSAIRTSYISKGSGESVFDDCDTNDNSLKYKLKQSINTLNENISKPNIYILYFLVTIKVLAENMVLSIILDQTLKKITHAKNENQGKKYATEIEIHKEYTLFQSYTSIIQSLSGFVMCSYYANQSDIHGRVHVLKMCGWWTILGSIANVYLYCFETIQYSRWIYIILYCIEGLNGGILSLTAIGSSYIFDISKENERFVKLSIFMSIIYGSIGSGPLIGSFLVKNNTFNNGQMIYLASIMNGLYFLGCCILLKESRQERDRRQSQTIYFQKRNLKIKKSRNINSSWTCKILNFLNYKDQIVNLFKPLKTLWVPRTHQGSLVPRYNVLILIFIEVFVNGFVEGCVPAVLAYAMFDFKWTSVEIGWFYSISGIVRCIVLLIVVPKVLTLLQKKFMVLNDSIDKIDKIYLNFFLIFAIGGFLSMIIIEESLGVYMNAIFLSLTAFAIPTIQNVIIKYSSKKNTSIVFAGIAILRNLVQLISPPILLKIYSSTIENKKLLFLYVPLVFSIFSLILLRFVHIVDDHELLRRSSTVSHQILTKNKGDEHKGYGSLTIPINGKRQENDISRSHGRRDSFLI
ncbi:uncharacterized protein HGUI_01586 [Hanseniaspora guilliermondii]|uniref:Major facilitator superfamily (MFS) profile domain-containing protein n=1 Tax=Hanseniaspora guilliermondii TaxID=56406 RepID=A0A1L0AZ21_9ASCO|nr:uncharacterized protein HGUI_01586 [Hanseniaspora guilliermondii]